MSQVEEKTISEDDDHAWTTGRFHMVLAKRICGVHGKALKFGLKNAEKISCRFITPDSALALV
jgi:hypothetical protein